MELDVLDWLIWLRAQFWGWTWEEAWKAIPAVMGVLGFGLALFSQWQLHKEREARRTREQPRAKLKVQPYDDGRQGRLQIVFTNPLLVGIVVTRVRLVEPAGLGLSFDIQRPSEDGTEEAPGSRTLTVNWTVGPADERGGQLVVNGSFASIRRDVDSPVISTAGSRWTIMCTAEEIAPRRRKISIPSSAVANTWIPTTATTQASSSDGSRSDPWLRIRRTNWLSRDE